MNFGCFLLLKSIQMPNSSCQGNLASSPSKSKFLFSRLCAFPKNDPGMTILIGGNTIKPLTFKPSKITI